MVEQTLPFVKYQSLGNDFIIFKNSDLGGHFGQSFLESEVFKKQVVAWCNRHFGIGADGVLVVFDNKKEFSVIVFNADGSLGQFSGNGIRCAAQYLSFLYPDKKTFSLSMGGCLVDCFVDAKKNQITTALSSGGYQGGHRAIVGQETFHGDLCDVGNPHFLIEVTQNLLSRYEALDVSVVQQKVREVGYALVIHQGMEHQLNVQFFWNIGSCKYRLIPFERGAGMTLACSSGAAALAWMFYIKKHLVQNQELEVVMDGGSVFIKIDQEEKICLTASAQFVFKGVC